MKLYRPVGLYEMEKILESGGKEFPPRFSEQPIFYPVLNISYAQQIAKEWNQDDTNSGFVGFVTEFEINDKYIKNFETHCVGSNIHQEYWIPAENLQDFNENITSKIVIVDAYYGEEYKGIKPLGVSGFKEISVVNQINILENTMNYNGMDFSCTIFVEWKLTNLNLLYWQNNLKYNQKVTEAIYKCLERNNRLFVINKQV